MSKKSRQEKKKKKKKKKQDVVEEKTVVAVIDEPSIPELSNDDESIFDKKDAARYFKGFLERHPEIEEAGPEYEAAKWYIINARLKYSRDYPIDELERTVTKYFKELAHEWKIYSDGPEISENI